MKTGSDKGAWRRSGSGGENMNEQNLKEKKKRTLHAAAKTQLSADEGSHSARGISIGGFNNVCIDLCRWSGVRLFHGWDTLEEKYTADTAVKNL